MNTRPSTLLLVLLGKILFQPKTYKSVSGWYPAKNNAPARLNSQLEYVLNSFSQAKKFLSSVSLTL
jgi:hypothetical protein